MDQISITGVRAHGRHGVYAEERVAGQEFVVDMVVELNTWPAAASDTLADTIDYSALAAKIVAEVEGEPVHLVETLAERLAQLGLSYDKVEAVTVTVHKPSAPMDVTCSDVAVTVYRQRGGRPHLRRIDGGVVA